MINDIPSKSTYIFEDYAKYFINMKKIKEIEHIDEELLMMLIYEQEDNYDNSGIIIIENRMALAYGLFDLLYMTCKDYVLQHNVCNANDKQLIQNYEKLNIASRILLVLNGEVNTAYTLRKRLFGLGLIKDYLEELHFIKLLCLKFKKSSVSWAYRKYIIMTMAYDKTGTLRSDYNTLIQKELKLHEKMIKKYPRNYYAWTHRKFIINEFFLKRKEIHNITLELQKTRDFCERNVHEYSAFHHLGYVISQCLMNKELKNIINLDEEIDWSTSLMLKFEDYYAYEYKHNELSEVNHANLESIKKYIKYMTYLKQQGQQYHLIAQMKDKTIKVNTWSCQILDSTRQIKYP